LKFELILAVKLETGYLVMRQFGSEFPTICNHCGNAQIITGKYHACVAPTPMVIASTHITRGNDLKLQKYYVKYDLWKFGFVNRVVNTSME